MRIAEKIGEDGVGVGNCVIFAHHDVGTTSNHRRKTLVVAVAAEETQNFLAPFRSARDFITDAEARGRDFGGYKVTTPSLGVGRSGEHTSELQSPCHLV